MMFQYESPPIRPPSEARSLLVRATRYCSWGHCTFCYGILWDRKKLELRPVEDIKKDILEMKAETDAIVKWAEKNHSTGNLEQAALVNNVLWMTDKGVETAFIGDSDSLIMKTDDLVQVLEFLYKTFTTLKRVTSYARAKTALKKSPEDLKELQQAGLSRLHIGLETGDDQLLAEVKKGATSEEMIKAGLKIKESGISLSEYILLGLGGQDRWEEHAIGTANVLNAIDPDFIRPRTLMIVPGTPLYDKTINGSFKLQSPEGILKEERLLISKLEVNSEFTSDHVSNYIPVAGKFPEDKQKMLDNIDRVLNASPDKKKRMMQSENVRRP